MQQRTPPEGIQYVWTRQPDQRACSRCGGELAGRARRGYLVDLVRTYGDHAVWCTCPRHECQKAAKRAWREVMHRYPPTDPKLELSLLSRGIFPDHSDYPAQRERARRHPAAGGTAHDLHTCRWVGAPLTPEHPMFSRVHRFLERRFEELVRTNEGGFRGLSAEKDLRPLYAAEIARARQLLAEYEAGRPPVVVPPLPEPAGPASATPGEG